MFLYVGNLIREMLDVLRVYVSFRVPLLVFPVGLMMIVFCGRFCGFVGWTVYFVVLAETCWVCLLVCWDLGGGCLLFRMFWGLWVWGNTVCLLRLKGL